MSGARPAIRRWWNPPPGGWNHISLAQYLREAATAFHGFYDNCPFLVEDADLRDARLTLALATRQVLRNGLTLLGVSAPESM